MKRLFNAILTVAIVLATVASCWQEPVYEAGASLHQVTDLKAVPGDGEVTLSWSLPQGWEATEFIISYTDAEMGKVSFHTGGPVTTYKVTGLKNLISYIFNVQAVYGDKISGAVSVSAKPVSTRFPVTGLMADAESGKVTLYWTRPDSDQLTGYVITYQKEDEDTPVTVTVSDPAAVSYVIEGLTDDVNYVFTVVAQYTNGDSDPVEIKAMPALAVPYILESEKTAVGLPVKATFNRSAFEQADNVTWTLPGGEVLEGDEVKIRLMSAGDQTVVLGARVNGIDKSWNVVLHVREYVIEDTDFVCEGTNYNGFKGSCPMFSPDGKTVYNLTFSKISNLMAYDILSGEKKWTYSVNHSSYNGFTVNPVTGDIYFGTTTAGDFFAVTPDGTLKWQFTEAGSMQSASPAVSADGNTVYLIDASGNTFALDAATGTKKWSVALEKKGGGMLVNGNDLVILLNGTDKTIVWLKADTGEEIVSYGQAALGSDISGGFAISPDKRYAYYGHAGGQASKIDLQERKIVVDCKAVSTSTKPNLWGLVTSPNGDVMCPSKDGNCYLLDPETLEIKATFESGKGNNAFNYARACSDTDGNFYISSGQVKNVNYTLGPDLTVKDSFSVGGDADKQMGGNNYLDGILYAAYIGKSQENGLFIGKYVGGERYHAYGVDICGSCSLK